MNAVLQQKRRLTLLGALFALAFVLRITGISFGLPFLYHADEPIVVNHAVAYGAGDFNPHFFKIPPLVSYLLFVCYGLFYWGGKGFGIFKGIGDFETLFLSDPSLFYLLARFLFGALLGTATVFVLYRFVRKFFSENLALLSAFFLAIAFLHVRDSHYVYADIPLILVLILGFFPILEIAAGFGGLKKHFIAGVFIGLATATKYNGFVMGFSYLIASLAQDEPSVRGKNCPRAQLFLHWASAGLAAISVYSLANPFSWFDLPTFVKEISMQARATGYTGWTHHLTYSLNGGIGTGLLLFGLFGLFNSLIQKDKKRFVLASFPVLYYLLLVFRSQPYDRYVLPIIPFILFFAADFMLGGTGRVSGPWKKFIFLFLFAIASAPTLAKSILCDVLFLRKDVRTLAKAWTESELKAGSGIALETPLFMPRLEFSEIQLEEKLKIARSVAPFSKENQKRIQFLLKDRGPIERRFRLFFLSDEPDERQFLFGGPTIPYDLDGLKRLGVRYVLIARVQKNHKHPEFYTQLKRGSELLRRFSPYRDSKIEYPMDSQPMTGAPFLWKELVARERNGQPIEVYRLR